MTAVASLAAARPALACATCATGDPTLTVMGAQQPFEQRLRIALELQHRNDAVGEEGVDRLELSEQRATLSLAYAPLTWLMLSASVPFVRRDLTLPSLAEETFVDVGDTELRVRGFVYRDSDFSPDHILALIGGVRIPTAPIDDNAVEPELEPGSGSFDPILGASYSFFGNPWSFYASEVVYLPTRSRADWRIGTSWRGTHAVQYQLDSTWATRLGVNTRLEAKTERADGTDESDTGGFILFTAPAVLVSPTTDLILDLSVHIPTVNALTGTHDEGLIVALGAAYDF